MLRFEKAMKRGGEYRVVLPGLRLMVPGMHKLARIHVRQRTINFPEQAIVLSDSTVFDVGAVLMCRVRDSPTDLYNALFETTGIDEALTDRSAGRPRSARRQALRGSLRRQSRGDLRGAREQRAGPGRRVGRGDPVVRAQRLPAQ